jgi:hypothetical protein
VSLLHQRDYIARLTPCRSMPRFDEFRDRWFDRGTFCFTK